MRRYWEVYKILCRNSLIREMSFKANFLLWMVTELLWFAGQIILIDVLFLYTESLAGWTKWEVVTLIGTNQIIVQVFQAFFYMNLTTLPELVRTGRLDLLLLLPLDVQFSVSTRQFGVDNLVNAAVGAGFVGYSLHRLGIAPGAERLAGYVAALGCGVAVHYVIMLCLSAVSFWLVRANGLIYGYFQLVGVSRYPEAVFRGTFRWIFSWLVPVIVVANLPARMLIHPGEPVLPLLGRAAVAALTALAGGRLFWGFALRRYRSASS